MVLVRPSPCKSGQTSYSIQQWIPLRTPAGCPGAWGIPRNAKPHDNTMEFFLFTMLYRLVATRITKINQISLRKKNFMGKLVVRTEQYHQKLLRPNAHCNYI